MPSPSSQSPIQPSFSSCEEADVLAPDVWPPDEVAPPTFFAPASFYTPDSDD